jgi:predicted molibdopterin-dependent oxidoreductase YjgC
VLYHWHGGTMTRRSKLDDVWPEATIEIHPSDALSHDLSTGDWVEVASRRGQINLRAMVTNRSPKGLVFIPFHFIEAAANILTNDLTDERAKIPDYKVCAVRIAKIEAPSDAPAGTDEPLEERGAIKDQASLVH